MLLSLLFSFFNLGLGFAAAVVLKRRLIQMDKPIVDEEAELDPMSSTGVEIEELEQQEEPEEEIDIAGPEDIPNEWAEVFYNEAISPNSLLEAAVHLLRISSNKLFDQLITTGQELSGIETEDQAMNASNLPNEMAHCEEAWARDLKSVKTNLDLNQGRFGPLAEFQISLDMGLGTQLEEAEASKEKAENVNFGREFKAERESLVELLRKRIEGITNFYDFLNDGFAEIISLENRLDSVDAALTIDNRSGILNTCGLAKSVFEWRTQSDSCMTFAILEIDDFDKLKHFSEVYIGDRIFQSVARVIEGNVRRNRGFDRVCQHSGHRFILIFGGTEQQLATIPVERIRRTLQASEFTYGNATLKVQVRAAIGEVNAQDEIIDVVDKLEKGLVVAQGHGESASVVNTGLQFELVTPSDDFVRKFEIDIEERESLLN